MAYRIEDASSSGAGGSIDEPILVRRAQGGDVAAFEILFESYNNRILRYLTQMVGNDGIGCELTQETFFKAWKGLGKLRDPERFASWLYTIATNVANTHRHQSLRWQEVSWETYHGTAQEVTITRLEEHIEENELLTRALKHVSPTYRTCLLLYVTCELSQKEIAHIVGIKESCVSKYVSRGKEELRQIYRRLTSEESTPRRGGR
jgi:RNA polymerase sigma-70 factor (ECF subfamily)